MTKPAEFFGRLVTNVKHMTYDKFLFRCHFIWQWKINMFEVAPLKVVQLWTYTFIVLNTVEENSGKNTK